MCSSDLLLIDRSNVSVTMVYIPGVYTPQFQWVLNKLPRRPQPVAPIYAPELIAGCFVHAAEHPRRRAWWVGVPTVYTIAGNMLWPQFLDRYLARTGVQGQQTDVPASADPEVNLWSPPDGPDGRDYGADGVFGDRAWHRDPQIWASRHHGAVAATLGAGLAAGVTALVRRR